MRYQRDEWRELCRQYDELFYDSASVSAVDQVRADFHKLNEKLKHYTPAEDGLAQSWQDERVFMNPPYGKELGRWMKKAYEEARDNGALVVCFVPARVDTNWWHNWASKGEVRFPKGRVKFAGADASAPFPVAVVIFRPRL
ncbi:MAG: adenine methyltransferase [Proteobacteria bacterium]|nr:adenine methyltransferase [Pseudomonadota bacterium]